MSFTVQQAMKTLKRNDRFRAAGRKAEQYLLNGIEACFDLRYNITTRWSDLTPAFADDEGYGPVSYPGLKYIHKRVGIAPREVLVDIGCGQGRAICVFSREPAVERCIGIEYHSSHAEAARRNAKRVRGRTAPITVIEGDAAEQTYDGTTLIFLFNPFGEATMRRTVERIGASLLKDPRPIRVVYVNPKYEHVLAEQPWLTKTDAFEIPNRVHRSLPTSVWHSAN